MENLARAKRILELGDDKIKCPKDVAVEVNGKRREIPANSVKPEQKVYDIGAVSYTHLTLPTKRIV